MSLSRKFFPAIESLVLIFPIITLLVAPLWLLGRTGQGREILILSKENFLLQPLGVQIFAVLFIVLLIAGVHFYAIWQCCSILKDRDFDSHFIWHIGILFLVEIWLLWSLSLVVLLIFLVSILFALFVFKILFTYQKDDSSGINPSFLESQRILNTILSKDVPTSKKTTNLIGAEPIFGTENKKKTRAVYDVEIPLKTRVIMFIIVTVFLYMSANTGHFFTDNILSAFLYLIICLVIIIAIGAKANSNHSNIVNISNRNLSSSNDWREEAWKYLKILPIVGSIIGDVTFNDFLKESKKPIHRNTLFILFGIWLLQWGLQRLPSSFSSSLHALIMGVLFCYYFLSEIYTIHILSRKPIIPVFVLFLVFVFCIKCFRNDLFVPVENIQISESRIPIVDNYHQWLDYKTKYGLIDSSHNKVYIISSEGGGIRSAYWTSGLLHKLDSIFPHFMERTYALSGVSGGSVGEMIYCALKKDNGDASESDIILGQDYLANALKGLMSKTTVQFLLPVSLPYLDNARILEDDWAENYQRFTSKETLNEAINKIYQHDTTFSLPNIFFNTTHVESGKKAIISNLEFGDSFPNDIDLLDIMGSSMPLKSAGLLSARFPGISPPGLVKDSTGNQWGKIVDGGYYDNSGLLTAVDIAVMINTHSPDSLNIKPVIIFIRNNSTKADYEHLSQIPTAPVDAFLNSWTAKTERTIKDVQNVSEYLGFEYLQFGLDYNNTNNKPVDYPLGWTLSKKSQQLLLEELQNIGQDSIGETNSLNYVNFNRLKQQQKL